MRSVQLSPLGVAALAQAVGDQAKGAPTVKALSVDEIAEVVRFFADAAVRCERAGFDFVEIHAGHGYLISAFYRCYSIGAPIGTEAPSRTGRGS